MRTLAYLVAVAVLYVSVGIAVRRLGEPKMSPDLENMSAGPEASNLLDAFQETCVHMRIFDSGAQPDITALCGSGAERWMPFSMMDSDPAGLLMIIQHFPPVSTEKLLTIGDGLDHMLNHSRKLVNSTETWEDRSPDATLHSRTLQYFSIQHKITSRMHELHERRTKFVDSSFTDAKNLSSSIEHIIEDYSDSSYVSADYWYHRIPGLASFSPIGRVKHEIRKFAKNQLGQIQQMMSLLGQLLSDLDSAQQR